MRSPFANDPIFHIAADKVDVQILKLAAHEDLEAVKRIWIVLTPEEQWGLLLMILGTTTVYTEAFALLHGMTTDEFYDGLAKIPLEEL